MRLSNFRRLNSQEQNYLCHFLAILVPVAIDKSHPMRKLARHQIAMTMWRWTADGFDIRAQVVKKDAIKFNFTFQHATQSAIRHFQSQTQRPKRDLRHEHAVPRMLLADHIIRNQLDAEGIYSVLQRFCFAVIVTKEQDSLLRRNQMPAGWSWENGNPWQRYIEAGLYDEIVAPAT